MGPLAGRPGPIWPRLVPPFDLGLHVYKRNPDPDFQEELTFAAAAKEQRSRETPFGEPRAVASCLGFALADVGTLHSSPTSEFKS